MSNLMTMAGSSLKGKKTLWEKEKLLIMSNFSFSHSVFKRPVLQTRKNLGLFGKVLRHLTFMRLKAKFSIIWTVNHDQTVKMCSLISIHGAPKCSNDSFTKCPCYRRLLLHALFHRGFIHYQTTKFKTGPN